MRRELRYGAAALRRRPLLAFAGWSLLEGAPAALSGLALARAVDDGFLAGRPLVGLGWLGALVAAGLVGAIGSRQIYLRLGDLVEPVRDDLVSRVVGGALSNAVAGRPDDGAVSRLTRQVEVVRDTFAGLIVAVRGFATTTVAAMAGLLSLAPEMALLILPPFLLGVAALLATLGLAAARYRASLRADERLATVAGAVFAGNRDVTAAGGERQAAAMMAAPIADQVAAERAMAGVSALRTGCFVIGGWLPLVALLAAGPWLAGRGYGAGAIMGGLTYVLIGLQPALNTLMSGLGSSGLRYAVALGRILDASEPPATPPAGDGTPRGYDVSLRGVTFAYGPHAEPVLRELDLTVPEGDHLAIVGPSGIGKSTLASLVCGLLPPGSGTVLVGGVRAAEAATDQRAGLRVLIPQEAYVFTGTVGENLRYLRPDAPEAQVREAVAAVGAEALVDRLGGLEAQLHPAARSAGERQLIALARAYLSPAPVAVLDEATCHLDPAAERRAEEAFARRDGTLIVIAHRVSSALRARRVLVLDGSGAALGDHEALQAASPLYRQLLGHWEEPGGDGVPTVPRAREAGPDRLRDGGPVAEVSTPANR
jgi:ATP-binding cassette, subfamily B, bacterial RamB/AmfA